MMWKSSLSKRRRKQRRAKQRNIRRATRRSLILESLERRDLLVVGAFDLPPLVAPGNGYDGVVLLTVPTGGICTGSLLSSGRHILTAAHCVADGPNGQIDQPSVEVTFNLPGADFSLAVPDDNFVIHDDWNGDARNGRDVAVLELPSVAPSIADRYSINTAQNEVGREFTIVGYGATGTGTTGQDVALGLGLKRIGENEFGALAHDYLNAGLGTLGLVADFDDGTEANDTLEDGLGLGLDEAATGGGDSGAGLLLVENRIAALNSFTPDDSDGQQNNFGDVDVFTRVSAPFIASFILDELARPYELVLDMSVQPQGNDGAADAIELGVRDDSLVIEINGEVAFEEFNPSLLLSIVVNGSEDEETITVNDLGNAVGPPILLKGNGGADSFVITPRPEPPPFTDRYIEFNGGLPTGGDGDSLTYVGDGLLAAGQINQDGFEDVNFTEIEDVRVQGSPPGFVVTQTPAVVHVSESGSTDDFDLVLTGPPDSDVVIQATSLDQGEATVSPTLLTFDESNWNVPQSITITGVNDNEFDGPQQTTITLSVVDAQSSDAFDDLPNQAVTVFTEDDELLPLSGASFVEQLPLLLASDGLGSDQLGYSVSIDGEYAVVGAPYADDEILGVDSGAAYVFHRSNGVWQQQRKLTALDGEAGDQFGWSVSISGDVVVVGARWEDQGDADAGAAYVYHRNGTSWPQAQKLTASNAGVNDQFGWSVAVDGEALVVGAYLEDSKGGNAGAAYVFERQAGVWNQQSLLTASDGTDSDFFGYSVAIDDDTVAVGAVGDQSSRGTVYFYVRTETSWSQQQSVAVGNNSAHFGRSVSLDGDTAVIGSPFNDTVATNAGAVFVYTREDSSWSLQQTLTAFDGEASDYFGLSVSLSGNTLAAGAQRNDEAADDSGAAYVYQLSGGSWTLQDKLLSSQQEGFDYFGNSVAISGNNVIVGNPRADHNGFSSGSASVFEGVGNDLDIEVRAAEQTTTDSLTITYATTGGVSAFELAVYRSSDAAFDGSDVLVAGQTRAASGGIESVTFGTGAYDPARPYLIVVADEPGNVNENDERNNEAVLLSEATSFVEQLPLLLASDGLGSDQLGYSVSIDGEYAVVGAPYADDEILGVDSGAAYVFHRSNGVWQQQRKLTALDGEAGDQFGWSVSISGDVVVVGARWEDQGDADAGAAYVYHRNGTSWPQAQKLTASNAGVNDQFGWSVAVDGEALVVGAYLEDSKGGNAGAAYVFERQAGVWNQQSLLTASDGTDSDFFGYSVAIDDDTVAVGAVGDQSSRGTVYFYVRTETSWSQQQSVAVGNNSAHFGRSVSLDGDTAVIGSPFNDTVATNAGAVFVYTREDSSWSLQQTLTAFDGEASDYFGLSVSLSGNTLAAGAQRNDEAADDSGAAYVYQLSGGSWTLQDKLLSSQQEGFDYFGNSVAISGNNVIVGNPRADHNGFSSGSASVFEGVGNDLDIEVRAAEQTTTDSLTITYATTGGVSAFELAVYRSSDAAFDGSDVLVAGQTRAASGGIESVTFGTGAYDPARPYLIVVADEPGNVNENDERNNEAVLLSEATSFVEQLPLLLASDGLGSDQLGYSVSIDGEYAVVGAPYADDEILGVDSGAAYVFHRSNGVWQQQRKLTALDGEAGDQFGWSVSISGDVVVVGARWEDQGDADAGAAYVYHRNGTSWPQAQKLTASNAGVNDQFGWSVAVDGEALVVGAYLEDSKGGNAGAAYVFERQAGVWNQQSLLTASDGTDSDFFGYSVAIDDDTVAVGAVGDQSSRGTVYFYVRTETSWSQQQSVAVGNNSAHFGRSVSLDGDTAVIGSPFNDTVATNAGAVFVYTREDSSWSLQQTLTAFDGEASDYFGLSVSLSGNTLAAGAQRNDEAADDSGAAYVYQLSGGSWTLQDKLLSSQQEGFDYFGNSVAISGNNVIVGNPRADHNGFSSGSASVFEGVGNDLDIEVRAAEQTTTDSLTITYATTGGVSAFELAVYRSSDAAFDGSDVLVAGQTRAASGGIESVTFGTGAYDPARPYLIVVADEPGNVNENDERNNEAVLLSEATSFVEQLPLLLASDGLGSDQLGYSVSIDGEYAVVGAPYADDEILGVDSGAAYVFHRSNGVWQQQRKLTALDGEAGDQFGWSVSISGDVVVVGARWEDQGDADAGAAYVYHRNGTSWPQAQKLTASNAGVNDQFGWSVAVDGEALVVGAYLEDSKGGNAGAAYVFERQAGVWNQQSLLTASDGTDSDFFGYSVAIDDDTVAVGAVGDQSSRGTVYFYVRTETSWSQQQSVAVGNNSAHFGRSVSLDGDTAVIGSPFNDTVATNAGAVFVYTREDSSWSLQQTLTAFDGEASDYFGLSVSLSGNTLAAGAQRNDEAADDSGAAYVYQLSGGSWTLQDKLLSSQQEGFDYFGNSVAISGNNVIVGNPRADHNGFSSGSASVFEGVGNDLDIEVRAAEQTTTDSLTITYATTGGVSAFELAVYRSSDAAFDGSDVLVAGQTRAASGGIESVTFGTGAYDPARPYLIVVADEPGNVNENDERNNEAVLLSEATSFVEQLPLLLASDGLGSDQLGYSVSIDGEYAVVGAPYADDEILGVDSGAAYVFHRSNGVWQQQRKLTALDGEAGDQFGWSVSISGDVVVVGARWEDQGDADAGAAYVYHRNGTSWPQAQKLTASNAGVNDQFGWSVAVDGEALVVGAYLEDSKGGNAGAAYVFERQAGVWNQQSLLTASDGTDSDFFGYSVAIDDDTVAVGAVGDQSSRGTVYFYVRTETSWSQQQSVAVGNNSAHFGRSVSLDGDTAVIGSPFNDTVATNAGAVFVYTREDSSWSLQQTLTAFDGEASDYFGLSVSLSGNTLAAGAQRNDEAADDSGAAYVYQLSGGSWTLQDKLLSSQQEGFDYFGNSVAISGNTVLLGMPQHDLGDEEDAGAAVIFEGFPSEDSLPVGGPLGIDRWWGTAGDTTPFEVTWRVHLGVAGEHELKITPANSQWQLTSDPTATVVDALGNESSVTITRHQSLLGDVSYSAELPDLSIGTYELRIDSFVPPTDARVEEVELQINPTALFGRTITELSANFIADHQEELLGSPTFPVLENRAPLSLQELIEHFGPRLHFAQSERYAVPMNVLANQPNVGGHRVPFVPSATTVSGDTGVESYVDLNPWSVGTYLPGDPTITKAVYASVLVNPADSNQLAINYYLFLPRSNWAEVGGTNTHEGDWEGVTIYLDRSDPGGVWRPKEIGASQHEQLLSIWGCCASTDGLDLVSWDRVYVTDKEGDFGEHPHLFIGLGGHATYLAPGSTNWLAPNFSIISTEIHSGTGVDLLRFSTALEYAAQNVEFHYLPRVGYHVENENLEWLRFPGRWGRWNAGTPAIPFPSLGNDGPQGPAFGARWLSPWDWREAFAANNVGAEPLVDVGRPQGALAGGINGFLDESISHMDLTFSDVGPSGLFHATITDAEQEFTLGGTAGNAAIVDGSPALIAVDEGEYTYRYSFQAPIGPGEFTFAFIAGSWSDRSGNLNAAVDTLGPTVVTQNPEQTAFGEVSLVKLFFDEDLNPATVSLADIVSFTGPASSVLVLDAGVADESSRVVEITIAAQTALGNYDFTIGPDIEDVHGNRMSDVYAGNFSITELPGAGEADIIWTNPAGGGWTDKDNWNLDRIPGPGDVVLIPDFTPNLTVTYSGDAEIQHLVTAETLRLTSGRLEINGIANVSGRLDLAGGILADATVAGSGASASFVASGHGTLDAVRLDLDLLLQDDAEVTVLNGLTLNGTATVNGSNRRTGLNFSGTQTLAGTGTVEFAADNSDPGEQFLSSANPPDVLTIGPGITIRGQQATISASGRQLINQGTIIADVAARRLIVGSSDWQNPGLLQATNGATLYLQGDSTSSGTIHADGGAVRLQGAMNISGDVQLDGTVFLNGTLENANNTLTLDTSAGSFVIQGGRVNGGTLSGPANSRVIVDASNGTLDAVRLDLDLLLQDDAEVTVLNGLTLNGTATVNGSNRRTGLNFSGTQTLAGTGTVEFAADNSDPGEQFLSSANPPDVLTIGPGITIRGQQATISASGRQLINQGTIIADVAARRLIVGSSDWQNPGLLQATNGATLYLQGDSTSSGTIHADGGAVRLQGAMNISGDVQLDGTVFLNGTLENANNTLTLDTSAGSFVIQGGRVNGGTLSGPANSRVIVDASNGTLDAVRLDLDLLLQDDAEVTVLNGLTLNGTATVNGSNRRTGLNFSGTQTLAGTGTVEFAADNSDPGEQFLSSANPPDVLTIGPGITIRGQQATISASGRQLINQGTIIADVAARRLIVGSSDWQNPGLLQATNGATLYLQGDSTSSGTIHADGGAVRLQGAMNISGDVQLDGTVFLNGTLENANNTLTLDTSAGSFVIQGGRVNGGTLSGPANSRVIVDASNGTLDAVRLDLDLLLQDDAEVTVLNGLTLNGTATVNGSNRRTGLNFSGTQTLAGTGTVEFAADNSDPGEQFLSSANPPDVLTIGPGITIRGQQATISASGRQLINQGTIIADVAARRLIVGSSDWQNPGLLQATNGATLYLQGDSTSSGTIHADGGAVRLQGAMNISGDVQLDGTVFLNGTLENANNTLTLDTSAGSFVIQGGRVNGGTLSGPANSRVIVDASNGTLDAVRLDLDLLLQDDAEVTVLNGLTLNGTATVNGSNRRTGLNFSGTQTLAGTGTVEFAADNSDPGEQFLSSANPPDVLTIGPGITIRGQQATISASGRQLINQGTIIADVAARRLIVGSSDWQNPGLLQATNGATLYLQGDSTSSGTIHADGGTVILDGTFSLDGNDFELNNGTVQSSQTLIVTNGEVRGSGDILAELQNQGSISPGFSGAGGVTVNGDYLQTADGRLMAGIGGAMASEYDRLNLQAAVALDGALDIDFENGFVPEINDSFVILTKESSGPSVGEFDSLPENAVVTVDTTQLRITYVGGDGNDVQLTAINHVPSADAGGPYEIDQGDSLNLNGGASSDPDSHSLNFAWEISGNNSFDDAFGAAPTLSAAQLISLGISAPGEYTLKLRVDDGNGGVREDTASLVVRDGNNNNPDPETIRFDLNGHGSPTPAGFDGIGPGSANEYTAPQGYGWITAAGSFDRLGPTVLLRDGHHGTDNTFLVDLDNGNYIVSVTLGDSATRDLVDVYAEDALVLNDVTTAAGQHAHRSFPVTVDDGQLTLRFDDDGFDPLFSVNAVEILSSQLTHTLIANASGTAVSGSGATPDSLVTVSTSHGSIASTTVDADPNYAGVQVIALGDGTFSFDLVEPFTAGVATITSEEVTGLGIGGTTVSYSGPTELHLDLNGTGSPTAAGFVGVGSGAENVYAAVKGYGWQIAASTFSGAGTDLLGDGHLGTDNTFLVDLASGSYVVNVTLGDAAARDRVDVYAEGGLVFDDVTTAAGQHTHRSFPVTITDGQLALRFDDDGFDPLFAVNAIEILPSQVTHTLTPDASGTTVAGSGATPGSLITVSTSLGSVAGTTSDDDPNYAGVQVTASGTGTFTFDITEPVGAGTATITSEEVTGLGIGSTTFAYAGLGPAVQICDNEDGCFAAPAFTFRDTWGFQGDVRFAAGDNSGDTASWTFTVDPGFDYRVSAYWVTHPNRATNAPYEIFDGTAIPVNSVGTASINQRVSTIDVVYTRVLDSGVWFADLGGPYTISGSTLTVTLNDAANGYVIADGIRIERLPALRAETAILDGASVDTLTLAAVAPLADEGRAAWALEDVAAGSRLAGVEVIVTDLPGKVLGLASEVSNTIWLDTNAAGHGWRIDSAASSQPTGMDLLSVISHELGHLLGLDDLDPTAHAGGLMAARLSAGTRRLPLGGERASLTTLDVSQPGYRPSTRVVDDLFSGGLWWASKTRPTLQLQLQPMNAEREVLFDGDGDSSLLLADRLAEDAEPVVADRRLLSELTGGQRLEHERKLDQLFASADDLLDTLEEKPIDPNGGSR